MPLRAAYDLHDQSRPWFGFNLTWACVMLERLNLHILSQDYCAGLDVFKPRDMLSQFEAVPITRFRKSSRIAVSHRSRSFLLRPLSSIRAVTISRCATRERSASPQPC